MLITATLDGYSSSSYPYKTHQTVASVLAVEQAQHESLGLKSWFAWAPSRKVNSFISAHAKPENDLLLVGKSLGALCMVERVINRWLALPSYRSVHLVTIDPNWPELWDWTPNLNRETLRVKRKLSSATNIYSVAIDPQQQAGAILVGEPAQGVVNIPILGVDHHTIDARPEIRETLVSLVRELKG